MTDCNDVFDTSPHPRKSGRTVIARSRWAVLATITLLTAVTVYNQFALSILAPEIMTDLRIDNSQFAGLLTAPMLIGVVLAIPAGGLADRFGVKRVVAVGFVASLLGLALRIVADEYPTYFVAMMLFGSANIIAAANAARLLRAWYGTRQVGIALGVFLTAGPASSALAQLTVPYFPSAQAFYWFGVGLFLLVFMLWLLVVQNAPHVTTDTSTKGADLVAPVLESVGSAIKNPQVLLVGTAAALFAGAQFAVSGFLPVALTTDRGFELPQAGAIAALYTLGTLAGSLISPLIASRLGRSKPVIIASSLLSGIFIWAAWMLASTPVYPVAIIIAGAGLGGAIPLVMSAPVLLVSVSPAHLGAAGGVIGTIEAAGVFALPTLVIARVAGTDYTLLFTLAAVTAALIALVVVPLPEFGQRRALPAPSPIVSTAP